MMQPGDCVEYQGAKRWQTLWASSDYPSHLIVGRRYVVESVHTYPWYTKITLEHKSGQFNSIHFKRLD